MDATTPLNPEAQRKQDRARKRKAILAGGVVLGLGAAVTLAAWSDDVFADGLFNTGTIELDGNVTDTADVTNGSNGWETYDGPDALPADDTGVLAFASRPQTLVPDEPVYAPIALRLSNLTTIDATEILLSSVAITNGPTGDPLDQNLEYTVRFNVPATTCAATEYAPVGAADITGTISDPDGSATPIATNVPFPATENTQDVYQLCLGVELTSNEDDVKGVDDTTVTWRFTAETD